MKNKRFLKYFMLFGVFSLIVSSCNSSNTPVETFQIRWVNYNNSPLKTTTVQKGEIPEYNGPTPKRNGDEQYTYVFDGWSPNIIAAYKDATYKATYKASTNSYTITWKNYDGTVLDTETYSYGDMPLYKGNTPEKPSDTQFDYVFDGWSPELNLVSSNATYTAKYIKEKNTFTVTWKNYDGTVLDEEIYNKNQIPSYKNGIPTRPSDSKNTYTFCGWIPNIQSVTKNSIYTADYSETINQYTITWKNYDGTVLDTESYDYGSTPSYKGPTPEKPKGIQYTYYFSGWSPEIRTVIDDATYVATFSKQTNSYTITWKNYDGTVLDTESYDYGSTPSYKGPTPEKENDSQYSYVFSNWDPTIENVTKDATYTAVFLETTLKYSVVWKNYDGSILSEEIYEDGDTPVYKGNIPTRESDVENHFYNFVGWSPELSTIKSHTEFTAVFELMYGLEMIKDDYDNYHVNKCLIKKSDRITIPSEYMGLPVSEINSNAFGFCNISNIVIPSSIKSIGSNAFNNCNALIKYQGTLSSWMELKGKNNFPQRIRLFLNGDDSETTVISIPDNITYINSYMFYGCETLSTIILHQNINSIYSDAFKYCYACIEYYGSLSSWLNLSGKSNIDSNPIKLFIDSDQEVTSIVIPEGTERIEDYAFCGLSSLKSVVIPDSVTTIGESAFKYCKALESIAIPDGVMSIGKSAFYGCRSIKSINIPYGIEDIKNDTFSYCSSLEFIDIPQSVKTIGVNSFYQCDSIESVVIPDSVVSLQNGAFLNCSSLKSVTLPFISGRRFLDNIFGVNHDFDKITISSHCEFIGRESFAYRSNIKEIIIQGSVKTIEKDAFNNCNSTVKYIGSLSSLMNLKGKNYLNKNHFKLFLDNSQSETKTIEIPNDVISIGAESFYNCASITEIVIPDSVTSIGDNAFAFCSSITKITIPDSVGWNIGKSILKRCESLKELVISYIPPSDATRYGLYLYFAESNQHLSDIPPCLEKVVLGHNCTSIPPGAFRYLNSVKEVIITGNITSMCEDEDRISREINYYGDIASFIKIKRTFSSFGPSGDDYNNIHIYDSSTNEEITEIVIPKGTKEINSYAFRRCVSITSVVIPDSVTSIGDEAFRGCTSLESITIPDSVTSIEWSAFMDCTSLKSIVIPDSVTSLEDSILYGCSSLSFVSIPDSVTSIGNVAFEGCTSLESITIPESVTTIKDCVFRNCSSLVSITIPKGVTEIGDEIFAGCNCLSYILMLCKAARSEGWHDRIFYNCPNAILYYYGSSEDFLSSFSCIDIFGLKQICFFSESKPTDSEYIYWHFVDGVPKIWE